MAKRTKSDFESVIFPICERSPAGLPASLWPIHVAVTLRKLRLTLSETSSLGKTSDPGWAVWEIFGEAPGSAF